MIKYRVGDSSIIYISRFMVGRKGERNYNRDRLLRLILRPYYPVRRNENIKYYVSEYSFL